MVQWLTLCLPMQGVPVGSWVRKQRSHMPYSKKTNKQKKTKQTIKQKQYCNKFNKDFKNGPHQKNKTKQNLRMFNS